MKTKFVRKDGDHQVIVTEFKIADYCTFRKIPIQMWIQSPAHCLYNMGEYIYSQTS